MHRFWDEDVDFFEGHYFADHREEVTAQRELGVWNRQTCVLIRLHQG